MVSIGDLGLLHLDLTSSSRCDPQIHHPGGKGRLHRTSGPGCHGNRSRVIWGTFDRYGGDEEHNADFPSTPVQQDQYPSAIQVG